MKVIQIGANNGKDETFSFIKKNNDKIELALIIEPIPFKSIQDPLKSQYKEIDNAIIENIAISLDEKEFMTLYYLENSNYEVSSFNSNHTKTHSPDLEKFPLCEIQVPCRNINQIIDKYNIKKLDYLLAMQNDEWNDYMTKINKPLLYNENNKLLIDLIDKLINK